MQFALHVAASELIVGGPFSFAILCRNFDSSVAKEFHRRTLDAIGRVILRGVGGLGIEVIGSRRSLEAPAPALCVILAFFRDDAVPGALCLGECSVCYIEWRSLWLVNAS